MAVQFAPDTNRIRQLRMRIETTDPFYMGQKKIKLRGRDLIRIPNELFSITELEVLDLSPERESCLYFHLQEVPTMICRLLNLRVLMLDTNDLFQIPPELCKLKSLEKLSLSNNSLTTLPENFANLVNLKSFHCANNKIVIFPQSVCLLENLEFLDFSDNQLSDIPPEIVNLKNLQSLLLFINRLVGLPDEICSLINLRCLWIGQNKIKKLPRDFGNLVDLDWGKSIHTQSTVLDGNPLEDPPLDICIQGIPAIEQYFKNSENK